MCRRGRVGRAGRAGGAPTSRSVPPPARPGLARAGRLVGGCRGLARAPRGALGTSEEGSYTPFRQPEERVRGPHVGAGLGQPGRPSDREHCEVGRRVPLGAGMSGVRAEGGGRPPGPLRRRRPRVPLPSAAPCAPSPPGGSGRGAGSASGPLPRRAAPRAARREVPRSALRELAPPRPPRSACPPMCPLVTPNNGALAFLR